MNTPKLLFHGTSAVSVWASYQRALVLLKTAKNEPDKFKRYLKVNNIHHNNYYKFGPAYPISFSSGSTHLTESLGDAYMFAMGWKRGEYNQNNLRMESRANQFFDIYCDPAIPEPIAWRFLPSAQFESPREITEVLYPLTLPGIRFQSPGAILIVDGIFMLKEGFLDPVYLDTPFVDVRATYLPWRAIRGMFFTYGEIKNGNICGYIYRDNTIAQDVRDYLAVILSLNQTLIDPQSRIL